MSTPQPPGQNPYSQPQAPQPGQPYPGQPDPAQAPHGQNPYGQNPYGQNPYGQPGGMPVPPPPAPTRSTPSAKKILRGIALAIIVAIAIGSWIASRDDAHTAAAGDCVVNKGTSFDPDVEVVECGSAKAEFKVAEKHDGEASCDRTKYAEYSEIKGSDTLFTLCLEPLNN